MNEDHTSCPIERIVKIIGNKWTMLIIRDLLKGKMRFGELQKSLVGISPRTLSQRLQELEQEGVIIKKIYPVIPPKTEYSLTPKGKDLSQILEDMVAWSDQHLSMQQKESQ